jgi:Tat protein translocase TatB subunit
MEIMVVALVALIVFGPARLPEMARQFGKAISELKRQANEMRSDLGSSINFDDDTEVADDSVAGDAPGDKAENEATTEIPASELGHRPAVAKDVPTEPVAPPEKSVDEV